MFMNVEEEDEEDDEEDNGDDEEVEDDDEKARYVVIYPRSGSTYEEEKKNLNEQKKGLPKRAFRTHRGLGSDPQFTPLPSHYQSYFCRPTNSYGKYANKTNVSRQSIDENSRWDHRPLRGSSKLEIQRHGAATSKGSIRA
ncbi:hypothetical protein V1478_010818 [Vespula squamosa]|uniref:Uncharacterized protein n=1 Tax=Vespula squamosa TaxID=30214 RepID=A0ABD2AFF4_VESSQ